MDFTLYILTAVSLVFVIEGLFYMLFPHAMRKYMATALSFSNEKFRTMGMIGIGIGLAILGMLQIFNGQG